MTNELPVDYVNLQQPSCSSASQPSSSSAVPEPIETCDRDLPVESVNLQQPSSSSVAPEPIETYYAIYATAKKTFKTKETKLPKT